jgi:predicted dehydrogenase
VLVEAAWNRWHPRNREAERLVAAGAVGTVQRVVSSFSGGPVPAGNYRYHPQYGGGALYDVGCYALAGALWAFGWQQPVEVSAEAEFWPEGADSRTVARLGFPGGGEAVVTGGLDGVDEQVLRISGSTGTLELVSPAWMTRDKQVVLRLTPADGAEPAESSWPPVDAYRLMVEEVSRAIRGEPGYVVPLEQSSAVAGTIDRIRAAVTPAG